MQINWFTFGAQIVNFLILVALLKHFLYGPIKRAMAAREQRIADRLEEAHQTRSEAERERQEFEEKNRELDEARDRMLAEAREEVESRRKELVQEMREQIEQQRSEWLQTVERERNSFLEELRRRVGEQVHAIAERCLEGLADASLEQQMMDVFLSRLEQLDEEKRRQIAESVRNTHRAIAIESTFELPDGQRNRIREVLGRVFGEDINVSFENADELICGIELKAAEYKVAWSVDEYLQSLEEEFAETLAGETHASRERSPAMAAGER